MSGRRVITLTEPDFVACVEAWAQREHRTPAATLRLLLIRGFAESERLGSVAGDVPSSWRENIPRFRESGDNVLSFVPRDEAVRS